MTTEFGERDHSKSHREAWQRIREFGRLLSDWRQAVQEQGEKAKPILSLTREMVERLSLFSSQKQHPIITPEVFDRFPELAGDEEFVKWVQTLSLPERKQIVNELSELEMERLGLPQDRREKLRADFVA